MSTGHNILYTTLLKRLAPQVEVNQSLRNIFSGEDSLKSISAPYTQCLLMIKVKKADMMTGCVGAAFDPVKDLGLQ